jgi:membrane protease YdiL (CAAX protease family)
VILFVLYQASEGLQTVFHTGGALGPALMLAALIAAWPLGRWLGWRGYEAYGLERFGMLPVVLLGGFALAAFAKGLSVGLGPGEADWTGASPAAAMIALGLLTTFVPSIIEDILTRGFLLRTIRWRPGALTYVLASAALYTLNHLWRFDWGVSEQFRLFCMGLAYAAAAWRWRSLWAAVALHWGWNFANAVLGPVVDVEGASVEAVRLVGAAAHIGLLAIVMLLPGRRAPTPPHLP